MKNFKDIDFKDIVFTDWKPKFLGMKEKDIHRLEYVKCNPSKYNFNNEVRGYDKDDNLVYVEDELCYWACYTYNNKGRTTSEKNSRGGWSKWEYDEKNNMIEYKRSDGHCKKIKYDEKNNIIEEKYNSGRWNKYKYDENDNIIYKSNNEGYIQEWKYINNNIISYKDSDGAWIKYEYDENNNMIYKEDSDGDKWKMINGKKLEYTNGVYYYDGEKVEIKT